MKAVKIYLVVVTLLLIGAIGLGVYAWYKIQQLSAVAPVISETETSGAEAPNASTPEPITVSSDSLSPTQQKMLETFGYTEDTFTITPTMIVCAESAVGKTRLDEIVGGSAPSPFESVKLLPCFKK